MSNALGYRMRKLNQCAASKFLWNQLALASFKLPQVIQPWVNGQKSLKSTVPCVVLFYSLFKALCSVRRGYCMVSRFEVEGAVSFFFETTCEVDFFLEDTVFQTPCLCWRRITFHSPTSLFRANYALQNRFQKDVSPIGKILTC